MTMNLIQSVFNVMEIQQRKEEEEKPTSYDNSTSSPSSSSSSSSLPITTNTYTNNTNNSNTATFKRHKHIQYFIHCLQLLPAQYSHLDTNRLTMVHFAIQSLDILGFLDDDKNWIRYGINKQHVVNWIYSLQITKESRRNLRLWNEKEEEEKRRQQKEVDGSNDSDDNHDSDDSEKSNDYYCCKHWNTCSPINRSNKNRLSSSSSFHPSDYESVGFKGGTFLSPPSSSSSSYPYNNDDSYISTHWKNSHYRDDYYLHSSSNLSSLSSNTEYYNQGHIAMTYTALCTLLTLGDNLQKIDKSGIIQSLQSLQQPNGSYKCRLSGSEIDLRFLYCACAISYILNDWSGMDRGLALKYIRSCRSYDGAFGLVPGQEGHGGSTFCAVACLVLMGVVDTELGMDDDQYDDDDDDDDDDDNIDPFSSSTNCTTGRREELIQWCVMRQIKGIQGRPNKQEDTCYSYWIGGTLHILGCDDLLDKDALNEFVLGCQTDIGGFSKLEDGYYPDLLHSFYSLAWLSLSSTSMDTTTTTRTSTSTTSKSSGSSSRRNSTTAKNREGGDGEKSLLVLNPLDCALGMCSSHVEKFVMNGEGTVYSTEYESDDENTTSIVSSFTRCFRSNSSEST